MKIAKLLSMAPVLAAGLALAAVSVAQVGCGGSKTGIGVVSLLVDRKDKQRVEVSLDKSGVLRLGDDKVEVMRLEGNRILFPGKSSDQGKITIGADRKIWADKTFVTDLYFRVYGRGWDVGAECYCTNPPRPRPRGPRKIGKINLWNDRKTKQKLELFLEANGGLRLGDRMLEELILENGVVYRPGESSDERVVAIGKDGRIQVDGVLATGLRLVSDRAGWDSGAKRYNLGPTPLKDPVPPRE